VRERTRYRETPDSGCHFSLLLVTESALLTFYSSIYLRLSRIFQSVRQKEYIDGLDVTLDDINNHRADLLAKKAAAVAFLNTVDSEIAALDADKETNVRGKVSGLAKMDGILQNKQAVAYMLKFSADKPYATQPMELTRAELRLPHTAAVDALQFLPGLRKLYKLVNLGLAEHPDFEGDNPSESNDFVGEILTGKGTTKLAEIHERIIKYLQVPALLRIEPRATEPASADTNGPTVQRLDPRATDLLAGAAVDNNNNNNPVSNTTTQSSSVEQRRAELLAELALLDAEMPTPSKKPRTK